MRGLPTHLLCAEGCMQLQAGGCLQLPAAAVGTVCLPAAASQACAWCCPRGWDPTAAEFAAAAGGPCCYRALPRTTGEAEVTFTVS